MMSRRNTERRWNLFTIGFAVAFSLVVLPAQTFAKPLRLSDVVSSLRSLGSSISRRSQNRALNSLRFQVPSGATRINFEEADFIAPNEGQTDALRRALQHVDAGATIVVGGERAFLAAAHLPNATMTYVVDNSPAVLTWAMGVRALISGSSSRAEYLSARRNPTAETWSRIAELAKGTWQSGASVLSESNFVRAWSTLSDVKNASGPELALLHEGSDEGPLFPKRSTYLHDDALFASVKRHVGADAFDFLMLDLSKRDHLERFSTGVPKKSVSLLNLSNLVEPKYLDSSGILALVDALKETLTDDAKILLTVNRSGKYREGTIDWAYILFPAAYLQDEQGRSWFIKAFRSQSGFVSTPYGQAQYDFIPIEGVTKGFDRLPDSIRAQSRIEADPAP